MEDPLLIKPEDITTNDKKANKDDLRPTSDKPFTSKKNRIRVVTKLADKPVEVGSVSLKKPENVKKFKLKYKPTKEDKWKPVKKVCCICYCVIVGCLE